MKKNLRLAPFTLVEILIAMGVCVIGICSIMVFFPVGAKASRNASMTSYASNAAEQFLSFARSCIEEDRVGNGYAAFQYFTGWNPGNPSAYSAPSSRPEPGPDYVDANQDEDMGGLLANDNAFGTRMQKFFEEILTNESVTITPLQNRVYYFDFTTRDGGESFSDFNCYAVLWATPVEAGTVNIPFAAQLHLELSWPAELPYDRREKREYTLEVFKAY
ncbi:MAG: hypothetical protein ACI4SG_07775 [Oligosphaeraceae bacterium]